METATIQETVKQIHSEFDFASEGVLLEAQTILEDAKTKDLSKGRRLSELGFTGALRARAFVEEVTRVDLSQEQAKTVMDYKKQYPSNKFIFRDTVQEICKKYGLICAESKCYLGDIPDKNIAEIEEFDSLRKKMKTRLVSVGTYKDCKGEELDDDGRNAGEFRSLYGLEKRPPHYFICAPVKDMDLKKTKRVGEGYIYDVKKPIPDPIVLCPVPQGFLIVTKWGDEENIEV